MSRLQRYADKLRAENKELRADRDEARKLLADCRDWLCPPGTGGPDQSTESGRLCVRVMAALARSEQAPERSTFEETRMADATLRHRLGLPARSEKPGEPKSES